MKADALRRAEILSVLYKHASYIAPVHGSALWQLCKVAKEKEQTDKSSPTAAGAIGGGVAGGLGGVGSGLSGLSSEAIAPRNLPPVNRKNVPMSQMLETSAKNLGTATRKLEKAAPPGSMARLKEVLRARPGASALKVILAGALAGGVGAGAGALGGMAYQKYKGRKNK